SHFKGISCFSQDLYQVRRWQHVVTVKRGDQMQLYMDGKLSGVARDATTLASGLKLTVGRAEPSGSVFQFIGQLDELAVYPRALTTHEIKLHYECVDWSTTREPRSLVDDI